MKNLSVQIMALILAAALSAVGFFGYFMTGALSADQEIVAPTPEEEGPVFSPEALPPADGESAPPESETPSPPDELPPPEVEEEEKKRGSTYIRAKTNGLNIRSGAGTGYSSLGTLDEGDMLVYRATSGAWHETVYRGRTAYVSAGSSFSELYTMDHAREDTIERVIEEGFRLLGHPYVYGAVRLHDGKGNFLKNFDKSKYDCSSLMQYIFYYGADVILDVTTRTQVKQGKHVAKSDLKRGDLMFFTNSARYNKTGVERIGHVALYLGDNYILHTATDHAVIEEISAQRWRYYIQSRRVA